MDITKSRSPAKAGLPQNGIEVADDTQIVFVHSLRHNTKQVLVRSDKVRNKTS